MKLIESTAVIPVDLHVSRQGTYPVEGLVEVWGHVGDYEVCVFLPVEEALSRGLVPNAWPARASAKQKKNGSQSQKI